jgi:hypothetical protein
LFTSRSSGGEQREDDASDAEVVGASRKEQEVGMQRKLLKMLLWAATLCIFLEGKIDLTAAEGPSWEGQVIGLVFEGQGKEGDFNWMITQNQYSDALFVFNDNEDQYSEHRDHPTETGSAASCAAGGGNAIIRPYQCLIPPRSIGIPTGPGYDSLTPSVKAILDQAIENVYVVATKEGYKRVFYNAEDVGGELGTHIFVVGDDVNQYIVNKLKAH